MKKNTPGEVSLTASEIQAIRLNKLEYRRLQRDINILQDDLHVQLARLQKQAKGLKYHLKNVVQVVKPNHPYQLWKQAHAYEIAQDNTKKWIASIKLQQKSKSKTRQEEPLPDEIPSEPERPLLVLIGTDVEKPVEPIIDFSGNFLRPKTSPINKLLPNQRRQKRVSPVLNEQPINLNNSRRQKPVSPVLNEQPINVNNSLRTQPPESDSASFLPPIGPPTSRKFIQNKFIATKKPSNLDTLYEVSFENQTPYKSVEQTRIVGRKLVDKEFPSQQRALKGIMRSTVLVK